jgi:hypothetical protein
MDAGPADVLACTEKSHKRRYSNLQYEFPEWMAQRVFRWGTDLIPDHDLYFDPVCPSYGREDRIHCTVFFGIHTPAAEPVRAVLAGEGGFSITLGRTSYFQNARFDVVKIDVVECGDLYRLHQRVAESLPCTETYAYCPHVTLAYVRPGRGPAYAGRDEFEGQRLWVNSLRFSSHAGGIEYLPLVHREPAPLFMKSSDNGYIKGPYEVLGQPGR